MYLIWSELQMTSWAIKWWSWYTEISTDVLKILMKSFYQSHIISFFFILEPHITPICPPPPPSCTYTSHPSSTQPFSLHNLYRIHVSIFPKYRHIMYFFKIHIPLLFLFDIRTPLPRPLYPIPHPVFFVLTIISCNISFLVSFFASVTHPSLYTFLRWRETY